MPIDKIVCVGKNYLEHALELGDAVPEKPVLFLKPASVLQQAKQWGDKLELVFPSHETVIHPECEIVLQVATGGYNLSLAQAQNAIAAVTLGLDMTLRTRQALLKKNGHPWTIAKVFPDAAVIGPCLPVNACADYLQTPFSLSIDDRICQQACGAEMMMKPAELVMFISQFFPLCPGDIIFTGTPAGVSSIAHHSEAILTWGNKRYSVYWR